MGLSRSLYTAWTGLATHQKCLDNTGNNLANVNTTGYKKNEFLFGNLFSQVLSGALPADANRGSTNPKSMGAGVTTAAITPTFKEGPIELTGNTLDVALAGNGFFLGKISGGTVLTRDGSFYLDSAMSPNQRTLCVNDGIPVQGWMAASGKINATADPGNIYLPALGDGIPGQITTSASVGGILPSSASGSDFTGAATRNLALKGNISSSNNTMRSYIYAPVTVTETGSGGSSVVAKDEVREIPVEITFTGPTYSASGATAAWEWEMRTVDWPNPGDPPLTIYPQSGTTDSTLRFYTQDDAARGRGAGQLANPLSASPGSSSVSTSYTLPDGTVVDSSFNLSSSFAIDASRLTSSASAPGGAALETWWVDGNVAGSMARTVTVYDQVTRFEVRGNDVVEVRKVEPRNVTLQFAKVASDNLGATWSWLSSDGHAGGTLRFNTFGDMVSQTGGGPVSFNFSGLSQINASPQVTVTNQDGYVDGNLVSLSFDQYGRIYGHYSNDVSEVLAQLAIANVANPNGLMQAGGSLFYLSPASGDLMIGVAGDSDPSIGKIGAGQIVPSSLEGSNVELATEFTTLITTERGYQANARVVTTSDEMLQELVAMKR